MQVRVFGTGETATAVFEQLRHLEPACVADSSKTSSRIGASGLGRRHDVLCVIVADAERRSIAEAEAILRSSSASLKLLMIAADQVGPGDFTADCYCHGRFVFPDMDMLLVPLRLLTSPAGLIGIDIADYKSVWANRWTFVERLDLPSLTGELSAKLPFDGLAVIFSDLGIQRIDDVINELKMVVPEHVDLIWRDLPARLGRADTVDVLVAYDLELHAAPDLLNLLVR